MGQVEQATRTNPPEAVMKIVNRSRFPLSRIQLLLRRVLRQTKYAGLGILYLEDARWGHSTCGSALKLDDDPETYQPYTPSRIRLFLRTTESRDSFPYTSQYVAGGPGITVHSWEEEVLLVLAHELRHLDQFWCLDQDKFIDHPDLGEVDAESFAVETLKQYRRAQKGAAS